MRIIPRLIPTVLLAGFGSLALVGAAAAHTLTVRLPDGTLEQINYTGTVAPQVSFVPTAAAPGDMTSDWAFSPNSPFALMQQISAQMDREAAAMLRQMPLGAGPLSAAFGRPLSIDQPLSVDMTKLPPGTKSYSFVASMTPSGVCTQSVEITSTGAGQKPQMVSQHSGNCGPGVNASPASASPAKNAAPTNIASPGAVTPTRHHAQTFQANAAGSQPYADMFQQASW